MKSLRRFYIVTVLALLCSNQLLAGPPGGGPPPPAAPPPPPGLPFDLPTQMLLLAAGLLLCFFALRKFSAHETAK